MCVCTCCCETYLDSTQPASWVVQLVEHPSRMQDVAGSKPSQGIRLLPFKIIIYNVYCTCMYMYMYIYMYLFWVYAFALLSHSCTVSCDPCTPHSSQPTVDPRDSSFFRRNILRASFLLTCKNLRATSSKDSWLWENVSAASWYLEQEETSGHVD